MYNLYTTSIGSLLISGGGGAIVQATGMCMIYISDKTTCLYT